MRFIDSIIATQFNIAPSGLGDDFSLSPSLQPASEGRKYNVLKNPVEDSVNTMPARDEECLSPRSSPSWENVQLSPQLNTAKFSTYCSPIKVYVTDEDSEFSSSNPSSPIKRFIGKISAAITADADMKSLRTRQHDVSGVEECHLDKPTSDLMPKMPSDDENYVDGGSCKTSPKNSKVTSNKVSQDEKTPIIRVKRRKSIGRDITKSPVNNESICSMAISNSSEPDTISPIQSGARPKIRKVKKVEDSGARPKIKKIKKVGAGIDAVRQFSKKNPHSKKPSGEKDLSSTASKQLEVIDYMKHNTEIRKGNLKNSSSNKKQTTRAVSSRGSFRNNMNGSQSAGSDNLKTRYQENHIEDRVIDNNPIGIKKCKSPVLWSDAKKSVVGNKTTKTVKKKKKVCRAESRIVKEIKNEISEDQETLFENHFDHTSQIDSCEDKTLESRKTLSRGSSHESGFDFQEDLNSYNSSRRSSIAEPLETQCNGQNDNQSSSRRSSVISLQGYEGNSKNDICSSSRRNSVINLQGSRCNSRADQYQSRMGSTISLEGAGRKKGIEKQPSSTKNSMTNLRGSRSSSQADLRSSRSSRRDSLVSLEGSAWCKRDDPRRSSSRRNSLISPHGSRCNSLADHYPNSRRGSTACLLGRGHNNGKDQYPSARRNSMVNLHVSGRNSQIEDYSSNRRNSMNNLHDGEGCEKNNQQSGSRRNSVISLHGSRCNSRSDLHPGSRKNSIVGLEGNGCSNKSDQHPGSRRNSIISLQGSRCSSRTDHHPGSRRNSMVSLQGSGSNGWNEHHAGSRRNSITSLGGRNNVNNDPQFLFVTNNNCNSALSSRSVTPALKDDKTDCSDSSPVHTSRIWNPYFNSKMIVASKALGKFENARVNGSKRHHRRRPSSPLMIGDLIEECNDSSDDAYDCSNGGIGALTADNLRSVERSRERSVYRSRVKRGSAGSNSSLGACSLDRDSAIGSMNSLIRGKNSFDRDPLSSSLMSLDDWGNHRVILNKRSNSDSLQSLDGSHSNYHRYKKSSSRRAFSSLTDVRDTSVRGVRKGSSMNLNAYRYSRETRDRRYKGMDDSRENLSKNPSLGSLSKLSSGWDDIKQCIQDKTNRWQPNSNGNSKNAVGWDDITQKILKKDAKKMARKKKKNFKSGGGEGAIEWVSTEDPEYNGSCNALQVKVGPPRSRSLTNVRAPRFSEFYGNVHDSGRKSEEMASDSEEETDYRLRRSKSLGRLGNKSKDLKSKKAKRMEFLDDNQRLQAGILRSLQVASDSSSDDESQAEGLESGLGSSCDEESDTSPDTAPEDHPKSEVSPSHPQKVYAAITNYLCTADQTESDDDHDSFNKEADGFDPEDLMLLTDNEENIIWEDLIVCYSMSPVHAVKHKGIKSQLKGTDIQPNLDKKIEQELDLLFGNYSNLDWHSMNADKKSSENTKKDCNQTEATESDSDKTPEKEPPQNGEVLLSTSGESVSEGSTDAGDTFVSAEEEIHSSSTTAPDTYQNSSDSGCDYTSISQPSETSSEVSSMGGSFEIAGDTENVSPDDLNEEIVEVVPMNTSTTVPDSPRGRSKTKEKRTASDPGDRSLSCSGNIKAFLLSQPCTLCHADPGKSGHKKCNCEGKHVDPSKLDVIQATDALCQNKPNHGCAHEKEAEKKPMEKGKKKGAKQDQTGVNAEKPKKKTVKKNMFQSFISVFCTTPVTVEGIAPDTESHDTDPEPLPPPIPPHAFDPEVMTADEAQRLLSANIVEGKVRESQSILSDAEAQEVVLLLSPPGEDSSKVFPPPPIPPHLSDDTPLVPPHYDIPPAVPPHHADIAPPVPPHYGPTEDEFDSRVASHFDPTLASPLSPEEAPSEADSSDASGDIYQVSRVKEVLVEDGIHYLEDGHFWVEIPGLPEDDDEEDIDPMLPFHPHTKLSFSKHPIQVFSTYSVTEYDRKNDEVDPVAASAEYELEKRVEKMDLFPVEIIKGEGGLGLSIIGMGVGADAGVEKLGIFVKTITSGGATERDGRIQVNDQIIEVDGKSLVGVTQVFAASVLKNTSGRVRFLIGREKDPENSEVALLIKQSLMADREREERRRALGGPDYDPHGGNGLFDPLSSPSEENSRSEEVHQNYSSYLEGGSSPTSPDAVSPPIESFDLEGDTSDTSPENDPSLLKLKLKEIQYKNAVADAEITKLKMTLLEMEKIVTENVEYSSQLNEAEAKMKDMDEKFKSKLSEVSTYQDMLEQSQGQYIILEKKYYKAKKIIKEYQGRERDFLHREEYHITQLEEKDSHYNALVKALKDRVINLEEELQNAQKKAGLPVEVPTDVSVQPAYLDLQQSAQSALSKQPPRKPSLCTLDPEISDTETSDNGASEGDKANTVERKIPVKEELDEAVPPHELLDVSASRAKGELAARGGLANRHLPSLKKTTSMSSAGSQEHSLDDSSLDDDLPEAQKHVAEASQDAQLEQGNRRSAEPQESSLPPQSPIQQPLIPQQPSINSSQTSQIISMNSNSSSQTKTSQPPSYSQATMGNVSYIGSPPPPPYQPPPSQFGIPRQPFAPSDPSTGLPSRPFGAVVDTHYHDPRLESRPEIPYRHPPPVARVQPVNRAEISESASLAAHLANRTPQQQSLAEQLKALLAEREVQGDIPQRNERDASPSKRSPTSLMEDVRQAVMQADVSLGKKPVISAPINLSSTANVVATGQVPQQISSPNRSQQSGIYSMGGRDSIRDSSAGSQSPKLGRSSIHASPISSVNAHPSGVVLLSQRPIDSSLPVQKLGPGVEGSSGDLSSGPASLGSGDEGSGASLGSQTSLSHPHTPGDRSRRSHMWQTANVIDWTKEQVSQWLVVQGLESCVNRFQEIGMTGPRLLNLDVRDLKSLGLPTEEKSKLKRKVKELRLAVEKERKQVEKEKKERERLQKKAEKMAEKAEKKKK